MKALKNISDNASIAALVGHEKADTLNTGVVKDAHEVRNSIIAVKAQVPVSGKVHRKTKSDAADGSKTSFADVKSAQGARDCQSSFESAMHEPEDDADDIPVGVHCADRKSKSALGGNSALRKGFGVKVSGAGVYGGASGMRRSHSVGAINAPKAAGINYPRKDLGEKEGVQEQTNTQQSALKRGARKSVAVLKANVQDQVLNEVDDTDEFAGIRDFYSAQRKTKKVYEATKRVGLRLIHVPCDEAVFRKAASAVGANKGETKRRLAKSDKAYRSFAKTRSVACTQARTAAISTQRSIRAVAKIKHFFMVLLGGGGIGGVASGAVLGVMAFIVLLLLIAQMIAGFFGLSLLEDETAPNTFGLPPYITNAMIEEALYCQEVYGHPAGATLAQIVVESGDGDGMSQLAAADNNLFGMKWSVAFAGEPGVVGSVNYPTYEEFSPGEFSCIDDYFTAFESPEACIRFRSSVFLQADRYAYNAIIQEACAIHDSDLMAQGLKDAGWATSSAYVEALQSVLSAYNLYRFDTMTLAVFRSGDGIRDIIVQAAYSQLGVPYMFGAATPYAPGADISSCALDCSGLTQYCYAQAGIGISHFTESQLAEALGVVPASEALPGDVLYSPGHVGLYVGGDTIIHTYSPAVGCIEAPRSSWDFLFALRFM